MSIEVVNAILSTVIVVLQVAIDIQIRESKDKIDELEMEKNRLEFEIAGLKIHINDLYAGINQLKPKDDKEQSNEQ